MRRLTHHDNFDRLNKNMELLLTYYKNRKIRIKTLTYLNRYDRYTNFEDLRRLQRAGYSFKMLEAKTNVDFTPKLYAHLEYYDKRKTKNCEKRRSIWELLKYPPVKIKIERDNSDDYDPFAKSY